MQNKEIKINMLVLFDEYWNGNTTNVLFVEHGEQSGNNRIDKLHALKIFGKDEPQEEYQSIKTLGIGILRKSFEDKTFRFNAQIDFYMGLHDFIDIYEIPPPNPTYQIIARGTTSGLEFTLAYVLESRIDYSHEQF
jgi:hypothetical protein